METTLKVLDFEPSEAVGTMWIKWDLDKLYLSYIYIYIYWSSHQKMYYIKISNDKKRQLKKLCFHVSRSLALVTWCAAKLSVACLVKVVYLSLSELPLHFNDGLTSLVKYATGQCFPAQSIINVTMALMVPHHELMFSRRRWRLGWRCLF